MNNKLEIDYLKVTEISGEMVTKEQIQRLYNRYIWAGEYCKNKKVLEVACGAGPGLGILVKNANKVFAGDVSHELVKIAKKHYGPRVQICKFDAHNMPFKDASAEVIVLFEAIYYLKSITSFFRECRRVLRPGGKVLVATANKDLFDFNPSPFSCQYFGVAEMRDLFSEGGFLTEFFGDTPVSKVSLLQKLIRPVKKIAVAFNVIPKTMSGKRLLKKIIFGSLLPLPAEINENTMSYIPPAIIPNDKPDRLHKVIFCAATLMYDKKARQTYV